MQTTHERSVSKMPRSTSEAQIASPSEAQISSQMATLSFAGTLSGSLNYERSASRLPPVSPSALATRAERRVKAAAAMLHTATRQHEDGERFARRLAERQGAELRSWLSISQANEASVRACADVRVNHAPCGTVG